MFCFVTMDIIFALYVILLCLVFQEVLLNPFNLLTAAMITSLILNCSDTNSEAAPAILVPTTNDLTDRRTTTGYKFPIAKVKLLKNRTM